MVASVSTTVQAECNVTRRQHRGQAQIDTFPVLNLGEGPGALGRSSEAEEPG